MFKFLMKL